ncbi:MAG: transglutaminase-like domain-containing protein, partial [bacterium]
GGIQARRHARAAALLCLLPVLTPPLFPARAADPLPWQDEWFVIYKGATPVGYTHSRIKELDAGANPSAVPGTAQAGAPRYELHSEIWMRIALDGGPLDSIIRSEELFESNLRLVSSRTEWEIAGARTTVTASADEKKMRFAVSGKKGAVERELDYPHGCIPVSALPLLLRELDLEDGAERRMCVVQSFPDSVRLSRLDIGADPGKKKLAVPEGEVETYALKMTLDNVPMVYRVGADGTVYENIQPTLGFIQLRAPKSEIPKLEDIPGWNPLETTAAPSNVALANPADVSAMQVELRWAGLPASKLHLEGPGQSVISLTRRRGRHTATLRIQRAAFPASGEGEAAGHDPPRAPRRRAGKSPPKAITVTDPPAPHDAPSAPPSIPETARMIAADAESPAEITSRLVRWLYDNILPDPRSWTAATTPEDVLRLRIGMDKHYAVLFAEFARALDIPVRICAGKTYAFGIFVAHYWNEVLIEGKWYAVDPASGTTSPPPLSVKLVEGSTMEEVSGALAAAVENVVITIKKIETAGAE